MENQETIELIRQELPGIMQRDSKVREWVLQLTRVQYADKQETESRFDRVLEELRLEREENARKWEEQIRKSKAQDGRWEAQSRKWDAQDRRWEAQSRKWDAQDRRWEAQSRKWDEQDRRWEAQSRKWDEQDRKWEANQKTINEMLAAIRDQARAHKSSIGALGARWGLYSEQSFRNGLKAILEDSFGVEVLNINEYDEDGVVFGHPDQVELDIIIQNGMLILCEIKSSMSKSDMYSFERKTAFYEKRHNRKAGRKLVISPMVDDRARKVAQKLNIEVYTHADEVPPEA